MYTIEVGGVCQDVNGTNHVNREKCDHLAHTVALINDKTDGFHDHLLPRHKLVLRRAAAGCSNNDGKLQGALRELSAALPSMVALLGPPCSSDVLSTVKWLEDNNKSAMVFSPSSTAPDLANDTKYPNLARMAATEVTIALGVRQLFSKYNWKRVGVLCDESVWAKGAFRAFMKYWGGRPDVTITNEGDEYFSHHDVRDHPRNASKLLTALTARNTKIVVLFTQPDVQRHIFAASWREKLLSGKGHAWFNAWPSSAAFSDKDGTIDRDAVMGAEGHLGLNEGGEFTSSTYKNYLSKWKTAATQDNCTGPVQANAATSGFCDADADPLTYPDRALNRVDIALGFSQAVHNRIQRGATLSPTGIYRELLALEPWDGASGMAITLNGSTGDRINWQKILNFQIDQTDRRARSRRAVGLTSQATWEEVGKFDLRVVPGLSFFENKTLLFPGATPDVPSDGTVNSTASPGAGDAVGSGSGRGGDDNAWLSAQVIAALFLLLLVCAYCTATKALHFHKARQAFDFRANLVGSNLDLSGVIPGLDEHAETDGDVDTLLSRHSIALPVELKRRHVDLVDKIASGNFGTVWKAKLQMVGVPGGLTVAVKMVESESAQTEHAEQALYKEAMLNAQISQVRSAQRSRPLCTVPSSPLPKYLAPRFSAAE